jgi:hypothetical protein
MTVDSLPDPPGTRLGGFPGLHGNFQPPMDRPYLAVTHICMSLLSITVSYII